MAIKMTPELIVRINERYCEVKNKAQIAREIGCSASTISKYIVPGYVKKADVTFEPVSQELIRGVEGYIAPREVILNPDAMLLTDEEIEGMVSLWEALSL